MLNTKGDVNKNGKLTWYVVGWQQWQQSLAIDIPCWIVDGCPQLTWKHQKLDESKVYKQFIYMFYYHYDLIMNDKKNNR